MDHGHRLAEARSLALHSEVAARLTADPAVLAGARARVQEWLLEGSVARPIAEAWAAVLERPAADVAGWLTDPGPKATWLRQTSPFAGVLDARTRWRIWRRVTA